VAKKKDPGPVGVQLRGVQLRGVGVGVTTASIGFEVSREKITLDQADELLVGARLKVILTNDDPDQPELVEGATLRVSSVADVGRISVGRDNLTGRFSFRRDDAGEEEFSLQMLTALAGKIANVHAIRVGDVGAEDAADAAAGASIDAAPVLPPVPPKTAKSDGPRVFDKNLLKSATDFELVMWQNAGAQGDLSGADLAAIRDEIKKRDQGRVDRRTASTGSA